MRKIALVAAQPVEHVACAEKVSGRLVAEPPASL
jgi:hypothetical protein